MVAPGVAPGCVQATLLVSLTMLCYAFVPLHRNAAETWNGGESPVPRCGGGMGRGGIYIWSWINRWIYMGVSTSFIGVSVSKWWLINPET